MKSPVKDHFIEELASRFGPFRRLEHSQSLFELDKGKVRIYVRYSRKHGDKRTFFGLRDIDLQQLEGHPGVLCFLWDDQQIPLLIPFSEFEEVFRGLTPASDGQFKVQVYQEPEGTELYIATAGRFNVDSYFGWETLDEMIHDSESEIPELTHSRVQSLLGGIGAKKGFQIWVPCNDRPNIDSALAGQLILVPELPVCLNSIRDIAEVIDVIWVQKGTVAPKAFFEIEHSTPIYSGLLRLNDVYALGLGGSPRFAIVSNEERRSAFVRQLSRPTFRCSGLQQDCTFLEYRNVYGWHRRLYKQEPE